MTEPNNEGGEPFSFDGVTPEDAPPIIPPTKPNSDASKDKPRGWARRKPDATDNVRPHNRQRDAREKREAPKIPNRKGQFVEPLEQLYAASGLMLAPFRPMTGQAVMSQAHECAVAVDAWAYQNEAVRRLVHKLVTGSAIGAVFAAHLPILMALAMESGILGNGAPANEAQAPRVVDETGREVPNAA
jgi:hypothetical protein